jgi:hypothetical protein
MTRTALLTSLALLAACPLAAQVGHPPGRSPYRDIIHGKSITPMVGTFGGNGGKLGIGPHDGTTFGARIGLRLSGTIEVGVAVHSGTFDRLIVDADAPVATRVTGPVDQTVTLPEAGFQLNLTGGKSWHRLAPYINAVAGLAIAGKTPADTSGFEFGTKGHITPGLGTRVFLSKRFHLRLEARQTFWKLTYPTAYADEPAQDPGTTESNAVLPDRKLQQWTSSTWLMAGFSFSF